MIKYDSSHTKFNKEYFPEISLLINDGIGIFNFGIGELASIRCGKTQLLSDLMYPNISTRNLLFIDEQNIMTNGSVDVLFENMCQ